MRKDQKLISDENVLLLEKGKRGLLNVLFGRTTIILLMLAAQFGLLFMAISWLGQYLPYIWGGSTLIGVLVVIKIMNSAEDPTVKLTWILLVATLPFFGTMLYLWIHNDIGHRILHKRIDSIIESTKEYLNTDKDVLKKLEKEDKAVYDLTTYLDKFGGYPVYEGSDAKYFSSGEEMFENILIEIEKAKHFIFLEYFIIDEGYMWGRILEVLSRKVKEGVEVRLMYDGTCALYKLPYNYPKKLQALGIKCKMFAPLRVAVSTHYNNRDHRKILVVDGHTAFTGGANLADEYINEKKLYGHWKDAAIMIKGQAVQSFTLMFLQLWNMSERVGVYDKYIKRDFAAIPKSSGYMIPYGDSPVDGERVGEMIYFDIINKAKSYVHIMTPYLILDNEMITTLTFAAKRGIDVKIILPHIPDKKYAFALAKTHYPQLIEAGVKIYEYLPGFVHSKVFSSDGEKAVVGTINLDYRSLYHHFECGVYLFKTPAIARIEDDFTRTLAECRHITLEDMKKERFLTKLGGWLLKLIAPLM